MKKRIIILSIILAGIVFLSALPADVRADGESSTEEDTRRLIQKISFDIPLPYAGDELFETEMYLVDNAKYIVSVPDHRIVNCFRSSTLARGYWTKDGTSEVNIDKFEEGETYYFAAQFWSTADWKFDIDRTEVIVNGHVLTTEKDALGLQEKTVLPIQEYTRLVIQYRYVCQKRPEPSTEAPTETQTEKPTEKPTTKPTEKPTTKPTETQTEKTTEASTAATSEPTEKEQPIEETETVVPSEEPAPSTEAAKTSSEEITEEPTEETEEPTEETEIFSESEEPTSEPTEPIETKSEEPEDHSKDWIIYLFIGLGIALIICAVVLLIAMGKKSRRK